MSSFQPITAGCNQTIERTTMSIAILRLPQVIKTTGLGRSTIYRDISLGNFPKPIKLGVKSTGWLSSDISEWIESRIEASNEETI